MPFTRADLSDTTIVAEDPATTVTVDGTPNFQVDVRTAVGPRGAAGVDGAVGPQGPAGPGFESHTHTEVVASTSWTITHGLNTLYPDVRVFETDGSPVEGSVTSIDADTSLIEFAVPIAGTAIVTL